MRDLVELFELKRGQWFARDDTQRRVEHYTVAIPPREHAFMPRVCRYCQESFVPVTTGQRYCRFACRQQHELETAPAWGKEASARIFLRYLGGSDVEANQTGRDALVSSPEIRADGDRVTGGYQRVDRAGCRGQDTVSKYYDVWCPRCGWHVDMIDERAANNFRQVQFCQDCLQGNQVPPPERSLFQFREHIINTRK